MAEYNGQLDPRYYDQNQQGGGRVADRTPSLRKFRSLEDRPTRIEQFESGQVIKAGTPVIRNTSGNLTVAGNLVETSSLTFNSALVSTNTVVVSIAGAAASITFTVGTAGATTAQLATAMSVLTPGITTTNANIALLAAGITTTVGTFTAMTVGAPDFYVSKSDVTGQVIFKAATALTDVTNLTIATTGTVHTLSTLAGSSTFKPPIGITALDVDASGGVTSAPIYLEGDPFANDDGRSFLRWYTPVSETVYNPVTNANVACTAYNSGCSGNTDQADRFKKMYFDNTQFEIFLFQAGANISLENLTNALVGDPA